MITKDTIDQIFSTARVEEVIGDFVQLKRSGTNYKGLSPFSNEKSPSFMVSPSKQIWKDFSSGKGGNAVTFLMDHEQFTYPEALRWLAKKYNIEIAEDKEQNPEQIEEQKTKESLFLLSEFAKKFFMQQLHDSDEGQAVGLSYFKERGFTKTTIDKFDLGYSPAKWDAFAEYAEKMGYSKKILEASGLVIYRDETGQAIDRFRERVMFPILSFSGRTLGFGGRILKSDKKAAKYLNSPESEIYHKSNILYGIFQSKQAILKQDECFLVEGYTDVISLHQAGVENVVASSGTALTQEQIRLVKRLTPNITVMYDGDAAGIKASFRGIDLILEQELNVKVLLFPEGEDPDSFSRKHSEEEIKQYIKENATDFIRFKAKILLDEAEGDPVKKASLIREIIYSISLVSSLIQRELYIRETASIMDVREEVLFKELAQIDKSKDAKAVEEAHRQQPKFEVQPIIKEEKIDVISLIEEEVIKLIIQFGDLIIELKDENGEKYHTTVIEEIVKQFEDNEFQLSNPFYQKILEEVAIGFHENQELRAGHFFVNWIDEEMNQIASGMMIEPYSISENWLLKKGIHIKQKEESVAKDLFDVIMRFKVLFLENKIHDFAKLAQSDDFSGEVRREILENVMKLTVVRNQLNQQLNRII